MKIVLDIQRKMVDEDILELTATIREMIRNGDPVGDDGTYTWHIDPGNDDVDPGEFGDEHQPFVDDVSHVMWWEEDDSSFHYSATQYRLKDGRVYNTENGVNDPLYQKKAL